VEVGRDYFTFSAAHFAQLPNGMSEPLHGHNYAVRLEAAGELDACGFVVDFKEIKQAVLGLTKQLNHRVLVPGASSRVEIQKSGDQTTIHADGQAYSLPSSDLAILPIPNSTCECLAGYLAESIALMFPKLDILVSVSESRGQSAKVRIRANLEP
jgi:6-pyruvoyltetrahydropterin/6-carboxytetrahydropterin synthase